MFRAIKGKWEMFSCQVFASLTNDEVHKSTDSHIYGNSMTAAHKCNNRTCINVEHIRRLTIDANIAESKINRRAHTVAQEEEVEDEEELEVCSFL